LISLDVDLTAIDLLKIGCELQTQCQPGKAVPFFYKALELDPTLSDAFVNVGGSLINLKRHQDAIDPLLRGLALNPENPGIHLNLATCYQVLLRFDEAREHVIKAISLNPPYVVDCFMCLSMNAQYRGEIPEAISVYQTALALEPGNILARMSHGMLRMLMGEWDIGLPDYEARIERLKPYPTEAIVKFTHRPGETLGGKRVLICGEQGAGDSIMFARYFKVLRAMHPTSQFTYLCVDGIAPWMSQYGVRVISPGVGATGAWDVQIPLMSLMLYFHDRNVPFIIPEEKPEGFPERTGGGGIGFCWKGNADHAHDRFRSMSLNTMLGGVVHHAKDFGVRTVNLQYGTTPEEQSAFDYNPSLGSWHETAAVLNTLDAVVTVDTGIAHMAGTLGVPVFMLMPVITDWRWGMRTETTPWYKSVRIFRQKNLGDWSPVMDQARLALEGLHAESR